MGCFFYFGVYLVLICLKRQEQKLLISLASFFPLSLPPQTLLLAASHGERNSEVPCGAFCSSLPLIGAQQCLLRHLQCFGGWWAPLALQRSCAFLPRSLKQFCLFTFLPLLRQWKEPWSRFCFSSSSKITTQTCSFRARTCASPFLLLNVLFRLEHLGLLNRAGHNVHLYLYMCYIA